MTGAVVQEKTNVVSPDLPRDTKKTLSVFGIGRPITLQGFW